MKKEEAWEDAVGKDNISHGRRKNTEEHIEQWPITFIYSNIFLIIGKLYFNIRAFCGLKGILNILSNLPFHDAKKGVRLGEAEA